MVSIRGKRVLVLVGLGALGVVALPPLLAPSAASLVSDSPKEVIDQTWQIVFRDYLDINGKYTPDKWRTLRRQVLAKTYGSSKESYEAIRGMLASLDDPYTRFMDPREFKEMQIDTSGELTGVGIQLSLDKETKELVVVSPIEGSPASRAGVMPKDVILSIDGKSTKGMSTEDAVKLIRGQAGTTVNLQLRRDGKVVDAPLVRARIELHAVDSQVNTSADGTRIGYIRLKQFNANAAKDMADALKKLEGENVQGYVLDLRSNPGGLLMASIAIARQWMDEGVIVSTKTRDGIQDTKRANGRALTQRPLVVLAGADDEASGADSPPPPPVSTDFNQAKNCGFCSATNALSPVILKNTVISPAGKMAASVRAAYLPSSTAFLPSNSYTTTWRLPAGMRERSLAKSASVAGSNPIWSRQRLSAMASRRM